MKQIVIDIPDNQYFSFLEYIKTHFSFIQIKEKPAYQKKSNITASKYRDKIPKDVAEEMMTQLNQIRKEWQRDI